MNFYKRTFLILRSYWKQLAVASFSAALHAIFSGMMVWVAGPLMMTLFQVENLPLPQTPTENVQKVAPPENSVTSVTIDEQLASIADNIRETMKSWVNDFVEADDRQDMLINFCWLILIIVLAKNVFLYVQGFFMAFVQQSVIRKFRNELFAKYQRLSLDYFHRRRTGQIISRVTNDVVVLNESIDIGFNRLVTDLLMAGVLFFFLIILSWKLTLLAMVVLPIVFGFIWFVGKKLRKYSERSQEKMADVNSVLEESITNMRVVKAFAMENFELKKFFAATKDYFRSLLWMTRIRHLASPINDMLATAAGVMILLYAGRQIISGSGEIDAGDFMTFIFAMFTMIRPVKSLTQIHVKLQEGLAAAERIFEVIDADEKIVDRPDSKPMTKFNHCISYEAVSFSYNETEQVLDNVSFTVNSGEVVAVVGPSGAGKSTLLDLLPRFYQPQSGIISIDGIDIRQIKLASLRNMMGIVTQETLLFNDTIANNIAYGLEDIGRQEIIEAAKMANAHQFIEEFAKGYESEVGNRGVMLSGGQRQRLAIARALLKNPQILIFDEATSALDTESELLVQQAIDRLMSGRTVLVIAHRLSTIKHADRIIVIDDGRIVESGNHSDLLSNDGLYNRLYSLQFQEV
ncbi:MAG: ABC transporter ATP-binding protein [candidate division Zixibacteria bacterium]|nr:ABC transporter ATP-binding protein [candidate division Zixibacteria bacterium]